MTGHGKPYPIRCPSMLNDLALDLLLLALTDDRSRRRLIGRLRPRLVGRPNPRRRLQRLRGPLLSMNKDSKHSDCESAIAV